MPTPPSTDVRQHTPDPRHRRRVAPSHLRIAQLGSAVNCSRTFACAPATRIQRTLETATIRGPHTAHRLFRSTGPPQRVVMLRSKRSCMIRASRPPPTRSATAGRGPEGSSRRETTLREPRRHHSERHPIQSRTNSKGRSRRHQRARGDARTRDFPFPCVTCHNNHRPRLRQRARSPLASADRSVQ